MNLANAKKLNMRFLETRAQLWLLDETEYRKRLLKVKTPDYYSMPILTADNQKVYVSFQWREKDIVLLDEIIKAYEDIFGQNESK